MQNDGNLGFLRERPGAQRAVVTHPGSSQALAPCTIAPVSIIQGAVPPARLSVQEHLEVWSSSRLRKICGRHCVHAEPLLTILCTERRVGCAFMHDQLLPTNNLFERCIQPYKPWTTTGLISYHGSKYFRMQILGHVVHNHYSSNHCQVVN